MVEPLSPMVPRGCLRFVIVVFPDHAHLLFLHQNEPHEQIETMANHGPLCKQMKSDKTSSNKPCGNHVEETVIIKLVRF